MKWSGKSILQLAACSFLFSAVEVHAELTCNTNIPSITPNEEFEFLDGGATVLHLPTDLVWKRCVEVAEFSDNGTPTDYSDDLCDRGGDDTVYLDNATFAWSAALQYVEQLNAGSGYLNNTTWRIPNIKELMSISDYHCSSGLNSDVFPYPRISAIHSSSPTDRVDINGLETEVFTWFAGGISTSSRDDTSLAPAIWLVRNN